MMVESPVREKTMSGRAKHILLVDDEAGLRQLLHTTLASPGFTIMQATSGDQALALAYAYHPDLVILDVHLLPEHPDGLEVCRRLKSDPATAAIRILILTAARQPEDRQAAEAAGADYYFTKPFSPLALLEHIYTALLDY
jgi:DNA-binding response OmpR family regulator